MKTSRPTTAFKSGYGYAMREIGYTKIYALARCFYALMMNRKSGMRMLKTYMFSDLPVYDELVSEWVKNKRDLNHYVEWNNEPLTLTETAKQQIES